jgi:benzoyl-CoA-dihydrodiol lyase
MFVISSPPGDLPSSVQEIVDAGSGFWPLAVCRALDHAISHLRFNEPEIGTWVLRTAGDASRVVSADDLLREHRHHWLVREIILFWKRTLKRLDLSARTLIALVEPGSCFTGTLAELALAADRSFMLDGSFEDSDLRPATLQLSDVNTGWYPMSNGLTRLHSRFYGHDEQLAEVEANLGKELPAELAGALGLVTFTHQLLSRRPDRHGGQPPLCRARDHGDKDLWSPVDLAELDISTAQCRRSRWRPAPLWHRIAAGL